MREAKKRLILEGFEEIVFPRAADRARRREAQRVEKSAPAMGQGLFMSVLHPPDAVARARREARVHARVEKRAPRYGDGLFTSVVYPREYAAGLEHVEKRGGIQILRLANKQVGESEYAVLKSASGAEEQRYTLGIAYPVGQVDAHGDYTTADELERASWKFMRSQRVGLMHRDGTDGSGEVVESYIHRGPPFEMGGETVGTGDWMLGVVWTPEAWSLIKSGQILGFSMQGLAEHE